MDQTTEHRVTAYIALAPPVPYFIDATSHSTGRHIKPTKRRIEFRFGFCSFPHLALGYTGAHCRGSEHSVVLIWSLVSGKRQVLVDGHEEYLSHAAHLDTQSFCHSFVIPGLEHNFQLVAHANGQSNLFVDGQSVFEMLRIYQLGGSECQRRYPHVYAYAKRVPQEKLKQALTMAPSLESECPQRRYMEQAPTRIVKEVDASLLSDDEEWDQITHLQPHDMVEETRMFQVARQRSLRNASSLNRIDEQEVDLIDLSEPPPPSTAPRDEDMSTLGDDSSSLGGWGIGPNVPTGHSHAAPPPPTWEQMHREFYPTASGTASTTVSGGWGTGPNAPPIANVPPPPTWEQTQVAFGVPPSRRYSE